MFQSNFDDFFEFGHHNNRPGANKVENRARMNPFCTRNIPTMFGAHILSFPISTTEKLFWSNFDDYSGHRHHRSKQTWKPGLEYSVLHPTHTNTVWGAVLIVSYQYSR